MVHVLKIFILSFFLFEHISYANTKNRTITLQLKWKHQFQFAGFYVAKEKGFYKDVGLNVDIKEGKPLMSVSDEVLSDRAQYGIQTPLLLIKRVEGAPVVVLAAIFQHSPNILVSLKDSEIRTPQELVGKTIMLGKKNSAEIFSMLRKENVPSDKINIINRNWDINNLINKKVDAISGYITDLPFLLKERNIEFNIIAPINYGIDFYGDCLFTTEKEISKHPNDVRNFLHASIKGWEYAMNNTEETADLILSKYSTKSTKKGLLNEAETMRKLMFPKFVEIGHMNPGRWKHIGDTFVDLKMIPPNYSIKGFIYNHDSSVNLKRITRILWMLTFLVVVIIVILIIMFVFNRRLNDEVRKRTAELSKAKIFLDAVIESLPGIFYIYENGEKLIRWNKNSEIESGYTSEELLNRKVLDWFVDDDIPKVKEKFSQLYEHNIVSLEANIVGKNGPKPYYLTGTILKTDNKSFLIGIGIDITQRRQLENQLQQSQKMETIGRLAGGVAHDFNNILTSILGYTDLLLFDMDDDNPDKEKIEIIRSAGERATELISQLLAFSRKQILEKKPLCINNVIKDILKILTKTLGENIKIKTNLTAENSIVIADRGQIDQVIMNLSVNARDAMSTGGNLIIRTDNIIPDKKFLNENNLEEKEYVVISVIDFGNGMDDKTIEKIFEPFFTTKELGKGTGLGLSTVYGIIKQHKGHVTVDSKIGVGTTFKIYLPIGKESIKIKSKIESNTLVDGDECIIVVDDELSIRKLILDTLTPLGYKCFEFSNGNDALDFIKNTNQAIELLLTDVIMPDMNGKELSDKVTSLKPIIKVLFMSGYTDDTIATHGVLESNINYLTKPITPRTLIRKIRDVLDK